MIIEEINKKMGERSEKKLIREILSKLIIPKSYKLNEDDYGNLNLIKRVFFNYKVVAIIKREAEVIILIFYEECEKELNELRKYFEESKISFKIILGGEFYY